MGKLRSEQSWNDAEMKLFTTLTKIAYIIWIQTGIRDTAVNIFYGKWIKIDTARIFDENWIWNRTGNIFKWELEGINVWVPSK